MQINWFGNKPERGKFDISGKWVAEMSDIEKYMQNMSISKSTPVPTVKLKEGLTLQPHQLEGVSWLQDLEDGKDDPLEMKSGLLLYSMGTGKSVMLAELIARTLLNKSRPKRQPSLIIVPKTLLLPWAHETFEYFYGSMQIKYLIYHKDYMPAKQYNSMTQLDFTSYDVIITSYDIIELVAKADLDIQNEIERLKAAKVDQPSVYYRKLSMLSDRTVGPTLLFYLNWYRIILDEIQTIVTYNSSLFWTMMFLKLQTQHTFGLSGTPIRNKAEEEMYILMKWLHLPKLSHVKEWQDGAVFQEYNLGRYILEKTWEDLKIQYNISPPTLTKENIIIEWPQGNNVCCFQMHLYELVYNETVIAYQTAKKKGKGKSKSSASSTKVKKTSSAWAIFLTLFLRLRQISIAPCLMYDAFDAKAAMTIRNLYATVEEKDDGEKPLVSPQPLSLKKKQNVSKTNDMVITTAIPPDKIQRSIFGQVSLTGSQLDMFARNKDNEMGIYSCKITRIIDDIKNNVINLHQDKIIVFSMFQSALKLFQQAIQERIYNVPSFTALIDSSNMSSKQRHDEINRFKTQPECRILLLGFQIGAQGLNLTEANGIISLDSWWNDIPERQAEHRVKRLSQKKPCWSRSYTMGGKNSIELKMKQLRDKKSAKAAFYCPKSYTTTTMKHDSPRNPQQEEEDDDDELDVMEFLMA